MASKEKKIILITYQNQPINSVKDLFDGLLGTNGIEQNSNLIYVLYNEKMYEDYELKNMIDMVKEDLNIDINIFESNILKDELDNNELIEIYNSSNKAGYSDISSLTLSLVEKNSQLLSKLKKYVLYSFEKDADLLFVCKAMFKNNLNVSKASDDAYMHRNTVINKLDIIYKKTGLNIQKFKDAMAMYILINTK